MTTISEVFALPQSWSRDDVMQALDVTEGQLTKLIKDGKVGWYRGRSGQKRFLAEHIGQIVEALEVKPRPVVEDARTLIGLTVRSAAIRRGKERRAQS